MHAYNGPAANVACNNMRKYTLLSKMDPYSPSIPGKKSMSSSPRFSKFQNSTSFHLLNQNGLSIEELCYFTKLKLTKQRGNSLK